MPLYLLGGACDCVQYPPTHYLVPLTCRNTRGQEQEHGADGCWRQQDAIRHLEHFWRQLDRSDDPRSTTDNLSFRVQRQTLK
jgi:hypothetical protein